MTIRIKMHINNISKKLSTFKKITFNKNKSIVSKGFTLIELLVVLSLFVVLTTIVLFSQSKFNGSILLTNLAYDVALTVRQAQTYGVNVREDVKNDTFQNPYGVHFDKQNNNTQFLLFSDSSSKDGKYNGNWECSNGGDECLNKYSIKRGNYISKICVTSSSGTSECEINKLDITFLRPDPDARFESVPTKSEITEAKITISSADNANTRDVIINSTGQISVSR